MKNIIYSACAMIMVSVILLEPCSGMNESELGTTNNTSDDSSSIANANIFSRKSLVDLSRIDEFIRRVDAIPDPYIVLGDLFKLPVSKARFSAGNWIFWDDYLLNESCGNSNIERLSICGNAKDIEIWRVLSENLKDKFSVILDDFHIYYKQSLNDRVETVRHIHNVLKTGGKLVTEYGFISDFEGEQYKALLEHFDVYYTTNDAIRKKTSPMGESLGYNNIDMPRVRPHLYDFPNTYSDLATLPCFMEQPELKRCKGDEKLLSEEDKRIIMCNLGGHYFNGVARKLASCDQLATEYNKRWPWRGNELLNELIADGSLKKIDTKERKHVGIMYRRGGNIEKTRIVLVKKALSSPQTKSSMYIEKDVI